jgi:dipeptidyl-peptidase-4
MRIFAALVGLGCTVLGCGGASPVVDEPGRGIVETMAASSAPRAGAPVDSAFFRAYAESRGFRLGHPTAIRPLPDGSAVLFLRASPRDPRQSLYEMDVRSGKTRTVIAPDTIARGSEMLSPAEKGRRERMRVIASGFTDYELTRDGAHVLVSLSGHVFFVDRISGASRELPTGDAAVIDPHLSPDGKSVAYLVGNDVFALGIDQPKPHAVTRGGSDDLTHGAAEFVAQEELDRSRGFWWSPDGRTVLFEEADLKDVERRTLADPGRPDTAPERIAYPRPGKKNAKVRLGLASARGAGAASPTWVKWDHDAYPYLARVVWSDDGPLLLYVLDRPQKTGLLLAVDPETGKTREVLREHDDAFLEVDDSVPSVLPGGREALWSSEREGVSRLYKADLATGALAPIGEKGFGYRSVLGVDVRGATALIEASTEPSEGHVYAVSLASGASRRIDQGQLSFAAPARNAPQQNVVPLREGGFGRHAAYLLRDLQGHELAKLPEDAEPPPFLPTTHLETVGPDQVRVAITVPRVFDPTRRYPVVDWAYGGPHLAMVAADADRCLFQQMLADRVDGVVVSIDARGTPYRGRDWERAIAGKFAEVPLEGHVTALHQLAAKHPEMDLERVGVVGWSFGGYFSALAILRHPELYKVAVSGAPVSDWTEYDTAYTERYLGVPAANEASSDRVYVANSLPAFAEKPIDAAHPARPLLLIHGTADDNVYFANSLELAGALERSRRPFELYPLVGVTHMPLDPVLAEAMWSRVDDFLAEHLARSVR